MHAIVFVMVFGWAVLSLNPHPTIPYTLPSPFALLSTRCLYQAHSLCLQATGWVSIQNIFLHIYKYPIVILFFNIYSGTWKHKRKLFYFYLHYKESWLPLCLIKQSFKSHFNTCRFMQNVIRCTIAHHVIKFPRKPSDFPWHFSVVTVLDDNFSNWHFAFLLFQGNKHLTLCYDFPSTMNHIIWDKIPPAHRD